MHDKPHIRISILNTIAALAALSLAACGKPSGPAAGAGSAPPASAKTTAPAPAKPAVKPIVKSAIERYSIDDAQQKKIAGIGKTISGKQIVMEEPGEGVSYYVYLFENDGGKYSATITHRFFGKAYVDRYDKEAGRVSSYIVEKDRSLAYFSIKNDNYKYEGKTYDEVLADRKAFIKDAAQDDRIVE